MRVIIAGSRTITNYQALLAAIRDSGMPISEVVSGCARGADELGLRWAQENNVPVKRFPADWARYGRAAGPFRNAEMARYAKAHPSGGGLIALWDGRSHGTHNMIGLGRVHGLRVHVHETY